MTWREQSCVDQVFRLRVLCEKYVGNGKGIYLAFML